MEAKKVYGFNCFGVCIAIIKKDKIEEWNNAHHLFNEKITSYREV